MLRRTGAKNYVAKLRRVYTIGITMALEAKPGVARVPGTGFAGDGSVQMAACVELHVLLVCEYVEHSPAAGMHELRSSDKL